MTSGNNSNQSESIDLSLYPPRGWDNELWAQVLKIANVMTRQELIIAWLDSSAGKVSEERFNREMKDLTAFSRQELIDLIHEIGPEGGKRLVSRYKIFDE